MEDKYYWYSAWVFRAPKKGWITVPSFISGVSEIHPFDKKKFKEKLNLKLFVLVNWMEITKDEYDMYKTLNIVTEC